ncbi:MAG TPA: hypothetical protein VLW44_17185 [Streptosporangiaceae bacterium]|nr:hypothetical protein [Streptosporangiaceae bacterium]
MEPDRWHHGRVVLAGDAARARAGPPAQRDAALAERGGQLLRDRYRPLIAAL